MNKKAFISEHDSLKLKNANTKLRKYKPGGLETDYNFGIIERNKPSLIEGLFQYIEELLTI